MTKEFIPLTFDDVPVLNALLQTDELFSCCKAPTTKLLWRSFHSSYLETDGCVIVKNETDFVGTVFDFPLKKEKNADINKALSFIEKYCAENGVPLAFFALTKKEVAFLSNRYSYYECMNGRSWRDYVYDGKEMSSFVGKKYAGQRNHINKFLSLYKDSCFTRLGNDDKPALELFLKEWKEKELVKKDASARDEFKNDVAFLRQADFSKYSVYGVKLGEKIIAFGFAEQVGNENIIHIEKALHEYSGVNVYMVREAAKAFPSEFIDREDDSEEYGLRVSKMQYHPVELLDSYYMRVKTEASLLNGIPTMRTERLSLGAITKEDEKAYYDLCTDDKRNKYWGYDYRKDMKRPLTDDYFYTVAKEDFKNRLCVNFGVKKDGVFIGETVVYAFDYTGGCQIGVRIAKEYAGHGYGEEAFEKTIRFALYTLGVKTVFSSCYKENTPSVKMHEKLFHRIGEDDEKYYYKREY